MNSDSWSDTYNALGFDPDNNYLYATVLGPVAGHPDQTGNTLLQIGSDGVAVSLGTIMDGENPLPVPDQTGPADGAFDADGNYWITWGNLSDTAYEINVTSSPPKVIGTITLTHEWGPIDFSLDDGYMWGVGNETGTNLFYRLNLSTGTVTTYDASSQIVAGAYGAAWTFTNGNLGFSNNDTGDIYQVSIANPSGTPTFTVVSHYTGPVAHESNDGAACIAPMTTDLGIVKTGPATVGPGGTITWTLTVTNHGPGASSGFGVSDSVPAGVTDVASSTAGCEVTDNDVLCSEGTLADGGTFVITVTGKAPTTLGTCLDNTATVTPNETDPNPANNTSTWETCVPGITVVKTANMANFSAPGTVITYSYTIKNDSTNETLTNVTLTDNKLGTITCPDSTLAPSQIETCTSAIYTTTQADVDSGGITNTATATGQPPSGSPLTGTSTVTVTAFQSPAFTLVKSADITGFAAPGTPVHYSYTVHNTGNVTLTNVTVTDPMSHLSAINCGGGTNVIASLPVGGPPVTCTATYTTTQADVDAGSITNTGTATATTPGGGSVTLTSSVDIPAIQMPIISIVKSASESTYAAGDHVTYYYLVTNSGNVTLTNVGVMDSKLGSVTCPDATLAPGASETCTATYTTTQADVDAGSITNTGTASGTPPTGSSVTNTSTLTITSAQAPDISIAKSASITSFSAAGTPITYMYGVMNTGNVTLNPVTVTDPMHGLSAISCPVTSLAPGAAEICTATYTTTQADVDAGGITNTGTATGTPPTGPAVAATSTLIIPGSQSPNITVAKSASIRSFSAAGTPVTYSYKVTNSGNVTLTSVGVTDPMMNLSPVTCPETTLAPGASETCTASYTTSQGDVDAGGIANTDTATGTPPTGSPVTAMSTLDIPAVQNPGITVAKSASITSFSAAGTPITYEYLVTNTGNVTLTSVGVTDPMRGLSTVTCPVSTLAPGTSETCTASYTTTQADVDAGSITNTGTATGTPPTGSPVTDSSMLKISSIQGAAVGILKSASIASYSTAGTSVTYSYQVTNSGNVTLNPVTVTDPMHGLSAISCPDTSLAPGADETCTASYTTTQADVFAGSITNTGTVTGTPPTGPPVTANSTVTIKIASGGGGGGPGCNVTLKGFTPRSGPAGTIMTIKGTNFSTAYLVAFQGAEAFVTSATATTVTVTVPADTMTGPITVWTHECGNVESDIDPGAGGIFKATSPAILSLSSTAGPVGTVVTIEGANLKKATQVSFDGTAAKMKTDTANQIVVTVPAGAKSGKVTVTTKTGTATSPESFTVT